MVTISGGPQHFQHLLDLLSDPQNSPHRGAFTAPFYWGGHNSPGDEPSSNLDRLAAAPRLLHQSASPHTQ